MDMNTTPFFIVAFIGIVVILISRALDILFARVIPVRFLYYVIRAPGVILHELSHILGCLIMGAKIKNVVLFSEKGGSVTYSPPKIPYFGEVVISTAPLIFIPLVLAGCTWVFSQYLGCVFPPLPTGVDSVNTLVSLCTGIIGMFILNLITGFNAWFLLYLYLTLTLVLSVAPSTQDMKNAAAGVGIIVILGVLILWSSQPVAVSVLNEIVRLIGIGLILGLFFEIIVLVIAFPLMILSLHKNF